MSLVMANAGTKIGGVRGGKRKHRKQKKKSSTTRLLLRIDLEHVMN